MLPSTIHLSGPLLTLRQPLPADDAAMVHLLSDLTTMQHLLNLFPKEEGWSIGDYVARRVRYTQMQASQSGFMLHVVENSTDDVIGMCGLRTIDFANKYAEIGIIIHHPYWRKGYSTAAHLEVLKYAFEELKLHRIFACTKSPNMAMRGFFEKFGFTLESIQKEVVLTRGKFEDMCVYVLLEDGWPATKSLMLERLKLQK